MIPETLKKAKINLFNKKNPLLKIYQTTIFTILKQLIDITVSTFFCGLNKNFVQIIYEGHLFLLPLRIKSHKVFK